MDHLLALAGGALIGCAAAILYLASGRVAGFRAARSGSWPPPGSWSAPGSSAAVFVAAMVAGMYLHQLATR